MSKIIFYLSIFSLLKGLLFLTPYSNSNSSCVVINKENDLLVLDSNGKSKELKIYKKNNQTNTYNLSITKNLKEFPSNMTKDLDNIYHATINGSEVVYFNEDFYSSYYFNKTSFFLSYDLFIASFLDKDLFIIPEHTVPLLYSFKIMKFDYKNDTRKFNLLRYYNFIDSSFNSLIESIYCTSINNTIICGFIDHLLKEGTYTLSSLVILNITKTKTNKLFEFRNLGFLEKIFLKIIALNEEKILFFFSNDKNQIICMLTKIINNIEIISLKNITIFNSFLLNEKNPQNSCSHIVLNNNKIIFGCIQNSYSSKYDSIQIAKITINNNEINTEFDYLKIYDIFNIKNYYSFQFLKDNNDYLILLIDYEDYSYKRRNGFHYFGYSTCQDIKRTIFNGQKTKLDFTIKEMIPLLNFNQNYDSYISFFFNDTELKSLITYNSEVIKSNSSYNKNYVYFYLNKDNYEYTINNSEYSVLYSNINDEFKSQKCYLNLSFYTCDEKCELCSWIGDCFDRNWTKISDKTNETNTNTNIFIIILIIIIVIALILFIVFFILHKRRLRAYNVNNINKDFPKSQELLSNDNSKGKKYNNKQVSADFPDGIDPIYLQPNNSNNNTNTPTPSDLYGYTPY